MSRQAVRIYPETLPEHIRAEVARILAELPQPNGEGPLTGHDVLAYGRISDDTKRKGTAIEGRNAVEQISDAAHSAVRLGADPARLTAYVENDRSAFKTVRVRVTLFGETFETLRVDRPVWRQMMAAVRGARDVGVIALDLDRMARDPQDVEDAIATTTLHGAVWFETTGGAMELDTPDGQMRVRMKVLIANKSSADTQRRVKRAHTRRIADGVPNWVRRPFGHVVVRDEKGKRIRAEKVPDEAAEIELAAKRILSGWTTGEIARDWEDRGIRTTLGGSWIGPSRQVHTNRKGKRTSPGAGVLVGQLFRRQGARLAGFLTHEREVIGRSEFIEPILDEATWRAVVAKLNARNGGGQNLKPGYAGGGGAKYASLLSGTEQPARCGTCDEPLRTKTDDNRRLYVCRRGCVQILADMVDREVLGRASIAAAEARVTFLPGAKPVDAGPLHAREAERLAERDGWQADIMARNVSREFALPIIQGLEREIAQIRAEIQEAERATASAPENLKRIFQEWDTLELSEQRQIVSRLFEYIRIHPRDRGVGSRKAMQEVRIATRFSDWLPDASPAAGVEVRGYTLLMDVKGNARVTRWILGDDFALTDPIVIEQTGRRTSA